MAAALIILAVVWHSHTKQESAMSRGVLVVYLIVSVLLVVATVVALAEQNTFNAVTSLAALLIVLADMFAKRRRN